MLQCLYRAASTEGRHFVSNNVPQIEFAQARGARLAYQTWGSGDAVIVAIPPLAQNIEVAWEWPQIREMLERFGRFSRCVHYDKRGTGASDRRPAIAGVDERVDSLRSVMDAAEVEAAHFFVQSDGGPIAILFAATYPHRVESLIFNGSYASFAPGWPEDERIARRERMVNEWGTPNSRMVDFFAPSLASNQEFRDWHQRYERHAASADSLRELLDVSAETDVREVLTELDVPTLVIHRRGDRIVPIELGRELARSIPGATLLELDGDNHYAFVGDFDEWMPHIEKFVTGTVTPRAAPATRSERVRIVTLGGFEVERNGDRVPTAEWGSRMARDVCKRLVAARGWPVNREELIDMLWPDESNLRLLGARLSVQLSAVRRVLGGGVIADRQSVRIDLDSVATDLEDFYLASDDAAIVAAYAGDFLPENRYDDWTTGVRDEARARYIAAARRAAEREAEAENHEQAVVMARKIVAIDPYDDHAHQLIVEQLTAAGEIGAARDAHQSWSTAMSELGIDVNSFDAAAGS